MKTPFVLLCLLLGFGVIASAQSVTPDLTKFADASIWRVNNRSASAVPDRPDSVRLDARAGDGAVWLVGSDFTEGTIELDVRGANKPAQSFVGLALRGVDDTTFDAVYFRPFNFRSTEEIRRAHAVQYVSMPAYPWNRLREGSPGKYEATVDPVPDPDGWFHARIVVEDRVIKVFVDNAREASLTVTELSPHSGGRIGLWVGNGSSGDFANLKIVPKS